MTLIALSYRTDQEKGPSDPVGGGAPANLLYRRLPVCDLRDCSSLFKTDQN